MRSGSGFRVQASGFGRNAESREPRVSGIWTRPSAAGPDYAVHFVSWSFAFLPGFLALFWIRRGTVFHP